MIRTTRPADPMAPAASSINSFGVELLRKTSRPDANALLSPYSLETGLVMTYAGAGGVTRDEMAEVLHLGSDEEQTHNSFGFLQRQLNALTERSAPVGGNLQWKGINYYPITLNVANRVFGQQGSFFKSPFTDLLKSNYSAPLESLDFATDPSGATQAINLWVEQRTRERIRNLLADGALDKMTRLVLANAMYMKAPWQTPFNADATKPQPFHVASNAVVDVATMSIQESFGYMKFKRFTAIAIPYKGIALQFLILLPDATDGLAGLELKAMELSKCADLPRREVRLYLPKFKMEPPTLALGDTLQALGMKTAFDPSRADFERISEDDAFFISAVFHKTFLSMDEEGTEAAAATASGVAAFHGAPAPPKPIEVRVDHPFLFAIQHRASGACLFLGHLADPRMTYLTK